MDEENEVVLMDDKKKIDQMLEGKSEKILEERVSTLEVCKVLDKKLERELEKDCLSFGKYPKTDSKQRQVISHAYISLFDIVKSDEKIHDFQNKLIRTEHELFKYLFGCDNSYKRRVIPGCAHLYERHLECKNNPETITGKKIICFRVNKGCNEMSRFNFDPGGHEHFNDVGKTWLVRMVVVTLRAVLRHWDLLSSSPTGLPTGSSKASKIRLLSNGLQTFFKIILVSFPVRCFWCKLLLEIIIKLHLYYEKGQFPASPLWSLELRTNRYNGCNTTKGNKQSRIYLLGASLSSNDMNTPSSSVRLETCSCCWKEISWKLRRFLFDPGGFSIHVKDLLEAEKQDYEKENLNGMITKIFRGVLRLHAAFQSVDKVKKKLSFKNVLRAVMAVIEECIIVNRKGTPCHFRNGLSEMGRGCSWLVFRSEYVVEFGLSKSLIGTQIVSGFIFEFNVFQRRRIISLRDCKFTYMKATKEFDNIASACIHHLKARTSTLKLINSKSVVEEFFLGSELNPNDGLFVFRNSDWHIIAKGIHLVEHCWSFMIWSGRIVLTLPVSFFSSKQFWWRFHSRNGQQQGKENLEKCVVELVAYP